MVEMTGMTAQAFFDLAETDDWLELLDGEIVMSPTPVPLHQRLVYAFATLIDRLKPDGEVFIAPLEVYLDEHNVPQPDVMWVAAESRCTVTDKRLEGAPDLLVEVHSPSTERRDKREKFKLYQRHQVREYWMVNPQAAYVEVWTLKDEKFARVGVFGPDDTFESPVLGGAEVALKGILPDETH